MTRTSFIIFLSIVLAIHTLVNFYIFIRGWQALEGFPMLRKIYLPVFIFFFLSYILARVLEQYSCNASTSFFAWTGSVWLGAMLYFILFIVVLDLIRLSNHYIHFLPAWNTMMYQKVKLYTAMAVTLAVGVILIVGFINAYHPRIHQLNLQIAKKAGALKEIRIAAVSDIHLGYIISKKQFGEYVSKINALQPDIILMAGDIFDEDPKPVIQANIGELFRQLKAPLGIYAITGNHEYIGGGETACKYMEEHGIKVLRDTTVLIDNAFYLCGREDKDKVRFTGLERKFLKDLINGCDNTKPMIVLDHQPFTLREHAQLPVDLQISGHTHNGQVWPFNYIVAAIFEIGVGYKQINNTHFVVSTGLGNWGPPIRIGNRPEILDITVQFN